MVAYRFCRPDDVPMLVRAVNECYDVHFPDRPPLTVEGLRREMKLLDVWPSNSMVAIAGEEPIAVSIGTKRSKEVLVSRVGVRRDHWRRGHGSHLLTSLSQKLAVLGPPRIVAEVPEELTAVAGLLESLGYEVESTMVDYRREPGGGTGAAVPEGLVQRVGLEDVEPLLDETIPPGAPWRRQIESLRSLGDELAGAAIASPDGLGAFVLYTGPAEERLELLALGATSDERRGSAWAALFAWLEQRHRGAQIVVPAVLPDEIPEPLLARHRLVDARRWKRYAAAARAL